MSVCLYVRSIYSSTYTAIGMFARNELDGRKALEN